jgi:hypothetical protein
VVGSRAFYGVGQGDVDGAVATHNADTTNVHGIVDTSALALTGHTHAGADIASGTVATARLDVGTSGSQVAAGNHTHTATDPDMATDHGYLAWSMPLYSAAAGGILPTAGTIQLTRIRRVPAGSVSNIIVYVGAGGSSLTSGQCFAALFTAAGGNVGITADQAVAWATSGPKVMPLAVAYTNPAIADLYVGMWFNGTTGPNMMRGGQGSNAAQPNMGLTNGNYVSAFANTGLTNAASVPGTLGTQTAYALHWWVALS